MNYNYLKSKMQRFFAKVKSEELIKQMEDLGYTFVKHSEKLPEERTNSCSACDILASGAKFIKAPTHTCEKATNHQKDGIKRKNNNE